MTRTQPAPQTRSDPRLTPFSIAAGDLLLAADATPASRAAVSVASAISSHRTMPISVITVVSHACAADAEQAPMKRQRVAHELNVTAERARAWPHAVVLGNPADEIVRRATQLRAQLIVLGLRPHEMVDRLFRDETALAVMQHANASTLGVVASMRTLPRSVVVGMDFSRSSIAAMHAAAALLLPGGRLQLLYVAPEQQMWARASAGISSLYEEQLANAFARISAELKSRWNIDAASYVVHGPVVPELRRFVREHSVDLIAIGKCSDAHRRCVLGSVATALTRTAECSLLVVPAS
ncbi:MAG: universal stress protein [Gemmatimonadaceae bacterium]